MKKFAVSLISLATLLAPTHVLAQNWVQVSGRILVDVDFITASRQNRNNIIYREKLFPPNLPGGYIIH
ncbi:MAG: hypothetical protein CLLPBCKN_006892 [Chroococcidiopsis cubana SAG 39.79]|nr:hypothetical protein [Chroococcidiopsis cubana SAG 39.79]PSB55538.1 hypothetical protein C7B79_33455 [Chroococcidiopsis cubana CCALA 043]